MPLAEYMRAVVNSNNNLKLDKKNRFKRKHSSIKSKVDFSNYPEASPELLVEIKNNLRKESRIKLINRTIATIVVGAILYLFIRLIT